MNAGSTAKIMSVIGVSDMKTRVFNIMAEYVTGEFRIPGMKDNGKKTYCVLKKKMIVWNKFLRRNL